MKVVNHYGPQTRLPHHRDLKIENSTGSSLYNDFKKEAYHDDEDLANKGLFESFNERLINMERQAKIPNKGAVSLLYMHVVGPSSIAYRSFLVSYYKLFSKLCALVFFSDRTRSLFDRLRTLEEKILHLESTSPEYFTSIKQVLNRYTIAIHVVTYTHMQKS